jgi:hypothetical protein
MDLDELSTRLYSWQRAVLLLPEEGWKKNRSWVDGSVTSIPLRRGSHYYVPEAHRRAHAQHDPLLAPHGFFRALPPNRTTAAIEFVEKFGPFDWPHILGETPELILGEFWSKHLRYVSVVRLWETRDDESQLRSAFSNLFKNLNQIHLAEGWEPWDTAPTELADEWWDLGAVPLYPLGRTPASRNRDKYPWERGDQKPEKWLDQTPFEELHELAIGIFHSELNSHLFERRPLWLRKGLDDPREPISFQLFFSSGNLWQFIWELTGLDTGEGRSWRLCPACNVFFYPKRSDQYYCKSEEQVRASKRNYARTRRHRERISKLLAPVKDSPEMPSNGVE